MIETRKEKEEIEKWRGEGNESRWNGNGLESVVVEQRQTIQLYSRELQSKDMIIQNLQSQIKGLPKYPPSNLEILEKIRQ